MASLTLVCRPGDAQALKAVCVGLKASRALDLVAAASAPAANQAGKQPHGARHGPFHASGLCLQASGTTVATEPNLVALYVGVCGACAVAAVREPPETHELEHTTALAACTPTPPAAGGSCPPHVARWLEWEAAVLRPAVLLHAGARCSADSAALADALQHLAAALAGGGSYYLVDGARSLADVGAAVRKAAAAGATCVHPCACMRVHARTAKGAWPTHALAPSRPRRWLCTPRCCPCCCSSSCRHAAAPSPSSWSPPRPRPLWCKHGSR